LGWLKNDGWGQPKEKQRLGEGSLTKFFKKSTRKLKLSRVTKFCPFQFHLFLSLFCRLI